MGMTSYGKESWEGRWERALAEHGDRVAQRPPSATLTVEVADLPPGRALDAGCGHGAESLWLAAQGWRVTGLDFSATALEFARTSAEAMGPELAGRIDWVEADLGFWAPPPARYDLVACLYVHVAGSVEDMVRRIAAGVAPGGTLLMAGHQPVDPATGEPTAAAGQRQVSVEAARAALEGDDWEVPVAEERRRPESASPGVDAVIRARRLG